MKPYPRIERCQLLSDHDSKTTTEAHFVSDVRKESLPVYLLPKSVKAIEEAPFDRAKSTFKGWVKDTDASVRKALELDL